MLRVIAGKNRGRHLEQPSFSISRPTSDRAKEAIFSMIQFEIEGSIVLDLFSGSGALGIEAASRGATKIISVENNSDAVKVINQNIKNLEIGNIQVNKNDVLNAIKNLKGTKFDFIFMDPPYRDIDLYNETLLLLAETGLLKTKGLIILETSNPREIKIPESFAMQKQKKYGKSTILVLANNI